MSDKISVVVPTYDRPAQLSEVVDHLLACDAAGFSEVEILVIDDGSPASAEPIIAAKEYSPPFTLRYIRQENAGPSAARNNGFRRASSDVVLFIDDDVLIPRTGLQGHLKAHHDRPGSVIFGLYPYAVPEHSTPAYRYLDHLERTAREEVCGGSDEAYITASIVASGNLSVERSTFADPGFVYDESVKTPMAEEIELALRLEREAVPIYYVPKLDAIHTQPTTIIGKCVQDYKYGMGVAEAYCRFRDTAPKKQFEHTMRVNGAIRSDDPLGLKLAKTVKAALASKPARSVMISAVRMLESAAGDRDNILFPAYRKAVGVHYFAGIRDGLSRFCNNRD